MLIVCPSFGKNEQVRDAFDRGGRNCTMTSGDIQKELAMWCAHEVTKRIRVELGDKKFSVLIDESRDISVKEQMAVMLRLVISISFIICLPFILYVGN